MHSLKIEMKDNKNNIYSIIFLYSHIMVTVLPDKMEFGELKRSVIIVPCVSFFEDIYSIERNFDFRGFFSVLGMGSSVF